MPNDSTENQTPKPLERATERTDYLNRLLDLVDRWRAEITQTTASIQSMTNFMDQISSCQREIKTKISKIETNSERIAKVTERRSGIMGALDWALDKAQNQTKAFLLVLMAVVALAVLGATLGWDIPRLLVK